MKADPCADLLGCGWLGWRENHDPAPVVCGRCGGPLLRPPAPTGLTALRAAEAARVLGERGEAS